MGLADIYRDDMVRMLEERRTEFGYRGGNYRAIRSMLSSEFSLGDYGYTTGYRFTLRAIVSELPQIPKEGELVSVGDEEFRILNPVEVDTFGVSVKLHLGGKAK